MVDTAARLIDEVLPPVPVRQWVLSLPFEIRYRLAWDGKLVRAVLAVFLRVVYGWYRRQAKEQGHGDGRYGSVSFVQRFGSALNLNPHYHVLMPDGVYVTGADGTPSFVRAPQLTDDEVQRIVETTASNVDPLWQDEPLLATITAASVQGQIATGERAGLRVRRRPRDREAVSAIPKKGCAPARCALPRVGSHCRPPPVLRPPIAHDWRSCAATSFGRPWPPGVCRSWMRTLSPAR